MPTRFVVTSLALAALVACKNPRASDPEPGPPDAELLPPFDPAALGARAGAPPTPPPAAALAVVDYGPQGRADGAAAIKVRFDQPVVALGRDEAPPELARRFTLDPPVEGRAYFQTPELLVFEPAGPLAEATRYTVRFAAGPIGTEGLSLAQGLEWAFETPRPQVVGATPSGSDEAARDRRRDSFVIVSFDQPTTLAEVRAHVQASARAIGEASAAARPVPLRIGRATGKEFAALIGYEAEVQPDRDFTVRPAALWPAASEVEVAVTPGLKGKLGSLPLDTPWSTRFATYEPQAIASVGCSEAPRCGLEPMYVVLRNPARASQARKVTITPRPKHLQIEMLDAWDETGGREVQILGQFVPGTTYTVRVDPGLKDIFGQTLGRASTREVVIERRPELALSAGQGTLIPARKQTVGVEARFVQALRVRVAALDEAEIAGKPLREVAMPGGAKERTIALRPEGPAGWASVALDLADLSGGARGPVMLEVVADALVPAAAGAEAPAPVRGVFRLTDLGPIVVTSAPKTAVQVLRLSDSAPVAGAKVSRLEGRALRELGVTDGEGLLVIGAPLAAETRQLPIVVADPATGDRTSLTIGASGAEEPEDEALRPGERLLTRIVADRGAYRPGEVVKVVGWAAVDTPFARSGLANLAKGTSVLLTLVDPTSGMVAERTVKTTAEGKYWAELPIPADGKLGRYRVRTLVAGATTAIEVKVEDYRVPEFSVTASVKRADLLTGERAGLRVAASYYFGGAVPIERLTVQSSCAATRYRPPGLDEGWTVGEPVDWRRGGGRGGPRITFGADPQARPGLREVEVATSHGEVAQPYRCTISAEVQDASFQGIGAEAGVQLHPAPFYLALGVPTTTQRAGARLAVPVRAVEIGGARVAAAGVKVMVERTWSVATERAEGGRQVFAGWVEKTEKVTTCALDLPASGDDPRCALPPLQEGRYTVRAEAPAGEAAGASRTARTLGSFQVSRAREPKRWTREAPPLSLTVEASATTVRPGEALEVAVQAPWSGSRGLLVLDRAGVREVRPLALGGPPTTLRFEADDTWTPAVHVRAFGVAPLATRGSGRPQVYEDAVTIDQGAEHRRLAVHVEAPVKAGPGETIALAATVRDAAGSPVAGRVALWAVDEAVLALTDYEVPDLLASFIPRRDSLAREYDDYEDVIMPYVPRPEDPWMADSWGYGVGNGSGSGFGRGSSKAPAVRMGSAMATPAARERFETTPIFLADLAADASGVARTRARLPENLTTFRIFAVASARLVDGTSPGRFGVGDARTTVTTPFLVRAAAPRQLRPGDAAEVAAIVQNFTEVEGAAEVELVLHDDAATPGPDVVALSPKTASVRVPAGGQARVPFEVRADARGQAKLELRATLSAGGAAAGRDAVKVALPVVQERTLTERVAVYGTVNDDRAVAIPVVLPGAVRPDVGGVTVSASASLLGDLQDAVQSLVTYPHGCIEQTSSRLLPLVSLAALHKNYPLGLAEDPGAFVKAGIERIASMQTADGGFAYWPGGSESHAYATAYATWVLQMAAREGHPVPAEALSRALAYLEARLASLDGDPQSRWDDGRAIRMAIALHALAEADRAPRAAIDALYLRRANLPVFGRAFLLMAMHRVDPQRPEVQALTNELLADLEELPATAHVVERVRHDLSHYFHSDGRNDAIVLAALVRARPDHPVVVKLARGLLERRIGGAWRNTQENAYALVGLVDYAKVYEADAPDFVARAWVGRKAVFEGSFLGRADLQTRSATTAMPAILRPEAAQAAAPLTVVLQREGRGRMYYRLGAEWAPADPNPPAKAHGLGITRDLRDAAGPLAGRSIAIGDAVAVDLTIESRTRMRYVAIEVPIPAGLEAVQLDLGKGQRASKLGGSRGWWASHQELRADRVVVYADDLPPGTHAHTLHLRATSRGEYQLPPAHAEAMYMPEVWGRSEGARVTVR